MERVKSAFHFLGFQLLTEQKLSQHIVKWWFPLIPALLVCQTVRGCSSLYIYVFNLYLCFNLYFAFYIFRTYIHKGLFSHITALKLSRHLCSALLGEVSVPCCAYSPSGPKGCALADVSGKGAACSPGSTSSCKLTQRSRGRDRGKGMACSPVHLPQGEAAELPLQCFQVPRQRKLLTSLPKSVLVTESPEQVLEFSCQN